MTDTPIIKKKDIVYFARIIPTTGIYEICELIIRTVTDEWFVGTDKRDKHAYLFSNKSINNKVFLQRKDALAKVKEAEKNKVYISDETEYEEY